jgi:hypothetical protein
MDATGHDIQALAADADTDSDDAAKPTGRIDKETAKKTHRTASGPAALIPVLLLPCCLKFIHPSPCSHR